MATSRTTFSPEFGALTARKRAEEPSWGPGNAATAESLLPLIHQRRIDSILSHGCGGGADVLLWRSHLPQHRGYDPHEPRWSAKPEGYFDLVVSTDVAEHVEEAFVPAYLAEIAGFMHGDSILIIVVSTVPALHLLPDGRNAHVTIHPVAWWLARITEAGLECLSHTIGDVQFDGVFRLARHAAAP
jgi:hypothetical protein